MASLRVHRAVAERVLGHLSAAPPMERLRRQQQLNAEPGDAELGDAAP